LLANARYGTVRIVGVGRFRSDGARDAYLRVYDRAMAAWPTAPAAAHVESRFGVTYVQSLASRKGSAIVLLHAIAVSSPMWFRAVGALAEAHPVHAIDTITDAGRSAQRAPIDDGADMAAWLDDVLSALALDGIHLVGISYGGWLALNQAQRAPGRLASVAVIDPPSAIGAAQVRPMLAMVPDAARAKFAKSDVALRRLLARMNNGAEPPQPVLDLAIAGLRSFKSNAPRPKKLDDDELHSVRTPTLVLLCEHSPINHPRRAAERARRLIPDVDVEVVAGAGHMLPVEQSREFTSRLLAFIDRVDGVEHPVSEVPR
jgi:pimeloyl-ACP methyl ester carboxylesterase